MSKNFPWSINKSVDYQYGKGTCKVAERINECEYLGIFMCGSNFYDSEINMIGEAFQKVYANLSELR